MFNLPKSYAVKVGARESRTDIYKIFNTILGTNFTHNYDYLICINDKYRFISGTVYRENHRNLITYNIGHFISIITNNKHHLNVFKTLPFEFIIKSGTYYAKECRLIVNDLYKTNYISETAKYHVRKYDIKSISEIMFNTPVKQFTPKEFVDLYNKCKPEELITPLKNTTENKTNLSDTNKWEPKHLELCLTKNNDIVAYLGKTNVYSLNNIIICNQNDVAYFKLNMPVVTRLTDVLYPLKISVTMKEIAEFKQCNINQLELK